MKVLVGDFNQGKALVAFSVIVQLHRLIVYSTTTVECAGNRPGERRSHVPAL